MSHNSKDIEQPEAIGHAIKKLEETRKIRLSRLLNIPDEIKHEEEKIREARETLKKADAQLERAADAVYQLMEKKDQTEKQQKPELPSSKREHLAKEKRDKKTLDEIDASITQARQIQQNTQRLQHDKKALFETTQNKAQRHIEKLQTELNQPEDFNPEVQKAHQTLVLALKQHIQSHPNYLKTLDEHVKQAKRTLE